MSVERFITEVEGLLAGAVTRLTDLPAVMALRFTELPKGDIRSSQTRILEWLIAHYPEVWLLLPSGEGLQKQIRGIRAVGPSVLSLSPEADVRQLVEDVLYLGLWWAYSGPPPNVLQKLHFGSVDDAQRFLSQVPNRFVLFSY